MNKKMQEEYKNTQENTEHPAKKRISPKVIIIGIVILFIIIILFYFFGINKTNKEKGSDTILEDGGGPQVEKDVLEKKYTEINEACAEDPESKNCKCAMDSSLPICN